jgi:hypothetical protein
MACEEMLFSRHWYQFNGIGSSNHSKGLDWKGNVKRTQLPADIWKLANVSRRQSAINSYGL